MPVLGVVKGFDTWAFQNSHVERMMDNAAYTAAHPDDTLVMAGPARRGAFREGGAKSLLAIGMLQAAQFTTTKPTQPMMAIGSGRCFYVSGKSQTQWSFGRLFVNGRNLLRVLYHNAVKGGINPALFDDPATAATGNKQYIASTPRSSTSDTTILKYLLENNIAKLERGIDLRIRPCYGLNTAGSGGTRRAIYYVRKESRLKMHIPVELQFLAPQYVGLEVEIPGTYRYSGVEWRYPKSALYQDNL
jgi:hypothetical protein